MVGAGRAAELKAAPHRISDDDFSDVPERLRALVELLLAVPGDVILPLHPRTRARLEEAGRCRRGYFIEHLGAAQFAVPATVDRLRSYSEDTQLAKAEPVALALAATDPANPFGAALPWPALRDDAGTGHRPGRKAGALVGRVDGALVLYVERGGKTLLAFSEDT